MRLIVVIFTLAVLWFSCMTTNSNGYMSSNAFEVVQVKTGDTVWGIAGRYVSDKDDIRNLIMAIREVNQLNSNAQVYPGQALKVPVKPGN